jgi:hypothetical protein
MLTLTRGVRLVSHEARGASEALRDSASDRIHSRKAILESLCDMRPIMRGTAAHDNEVRPFCRPFKANQAVSTRPSAHLALFRAATAQGSRAARIPGRQGGGGSWASGLSGFRLGADPPGRAGGEAGCGGSARTVLQTHGQGSRSHSEADDHGHLHDPLGRPRYHDALQLRPLTCGNVGHEQADLTPGTLGRQRNELSGRP